LVSKSGAQRFNRKNGFRRRLSQRHSNFTFWNWLPRMISFLPVELLNNILTFQNRRDEWIQRAEQMGLAIDDASFAMLWATQSDALLVKIFSRLDLNTIWLVSRVCKSFKRAASDDKVWIGLVDQHFPLASSVLERSKPATFINWMDYFRSRFTCQKQLAREYPRHLRAMRLLPPTEGRDPTRQESILSYPITIFEIHLRALDRILRAVECFLTITQRLLQICSIQGRRSSYRGSKIRF
jgi:hypothetical protein